MMADEQLARLFIYLADGTNVNPIMNDKLNGEKNRLKILWHGLYNAFKK